jgi:hypothetical protein
MASSKSRDFLASRSFAAGAFEEQQALFDRSIDQLSAALMEPVGHGLKAQLAHDLADAHMSTARTILDSMLGARPNEGQRSSASTEIARRLRAELDRPTMLDEEDIDREVRSCSREIAERVLARWLDRLNRALLVSSSLRLNANLLPEATSIDEMLAGIDFESHGVSKVLVINGLRTYWEQLTQAALEKHEPIELGDRLWVVPDAANADQPFVLFSDGLEARKRAKGTVKVEVSSSGERARRRAERYVNLYRLVRIVLASGREVSYQNDLALGMFRSCVTATNQRVIWDSTQISSALFSERKTDPERSLIESVGLGVDLVVAGLGKSEEEVRSLFHSDAAGLPKYLRVYSQFRGMPIDAVEDAVAMAVSVAVEDQPMRNQETIEWTSSLKATFDPYERFAEVHRMTRPSVDELMNVALAGRALASPGVPMVP